MPSLAISSLIWLPLRSSPTSVNRSTFYLHYENTYDLLNETIENLYKNFYSRYDESLSMDKINNKTDDELFLIKSSSVIDPPQK